MGWNPAVGDEPVAPQRQQLAKIIYHRNGRDAPHAHDVLLEFGSIPQPAEAILTASLLVMGLFKSVCH
jgi:hypothetical protein